MPSWKDCTKCGSLLDVSSHPNFCSACGTKVTSAQKACAEFWESQTTPKKMFLHHFLPFLFMTMMGGLMIGIGSSSGFLLILFGMIYGLLSLFVRVWWLEKKTASLYYPALTRS